MTDLVYISGVIESAEMKYEKLWLKLDGDRLLTLHDDGQSCCEKRYMTTDDTLSEYVGATIRKVECADVQSSGSDCDIHEVQFVRVVTDRGVIVLSTHNEHNGYYGGFDVVATIKLRRDHVDPAGDQSV